MRVWRLVGARHAASALDGEGAAQYGGRWNPVGHRMVYTADSLALATLELSVHLVGGRARYVAIELDVPDASVDVIDPDGLKRSWSTDEASTQRIGLAWLNAAGSVALGVPSALVDPRSGERNVLVNPAHPTARTIREVQRFAVLLDERL